MYVVLALVLLGLQALSVESGRVKKLVLHDELSLAEKMESLEAAMDRMNATFTKEVNDLKAALQAEKRERCQVGTIDFHKLTCPSTSCHEDLNIQFNPTFASVPSVVFAIERLDIDANHNVRIASSVGHVTTSGATLTVTTWADTIVFASSLSWMACPK